MRVEVAIAVSLLLAVAVLALTSQLLDVRRECAEAERLCSICESRSGGSGVLP